jgi:rhodanese-related sulfurtransferase
MTCLLFMLSLSCTNGASTQESSTANKRIPVTASVTELYQQTQAHDPLIIDVRTKEEFASGHIPRAKNIPLSELSVRLEELRASQGQAIYLVCAVGGRSGQAQLVMNNAGFSTINVIGGTNDWKRQGYPLEEQR